MAAITSAQSGLWSATTTWVGGVVPGIADTVTIAATHVVTVDGTYTTGGDTAGGFILSGTLKASRTVNSSLTVRANINPNTAGGGFDYGTLADPIPQGVTATLIYNDSATLAANKYQILLNANNSNVRFCGAPKTRNAFLTAPVSAGATSISVTSASGWAVGDQLYLEQPTTTMSQIETVTITSISGTTIGVSAITNARVSGLAVSNITTNVILRTSSASFGSSANFRVGTTTGVCEFRNVLFNTLGDLIFPANTSVANLPIIDSCITQNSATVNARFVPQNQYTIGNITLSNNVFINNNSNQIITPSLTQVNFNNNVCYHLSTTAFSGCVGSAYGNFGTGNRFNGYNQVFQFSNASLSVYTNTRIRTQAASSIGNTFGDFNVLFENADIVTAGVFNYTAIGGAFGTITFQNPTVDSVTKFNGTFQIGTAKVISYSINGVFNANRLSTYTTLAINQNAVVNRATNNIALQLNTSQPAGSYTFTFQGVTGVSQRIVGYLRHDTTYGTSNPPSIAFSGAGVSGSFVSSPTVDLWEKFDITLTPTSVGTITATVTFAGAAGGTAYLDGVYQFPWITENWIYGFQKLSQVNSVVDSKITLSESAVAALTSCTNLDDVYDSATYWSVVNFTSSGYNILANANGTLLDFLANNVAINNGAASNFSYSGTTATIKSALLTVGAKFKSIKASLFTLLSPVTNITLVGNVNQDIPTNLTGVINNDIWTYNTNTNITITITNCTLGTVRNLGTGIITINKVNSTIANYTDAEINFIDSTISVVGADTVTFHPTSTDRDLNTNISGTFTGFYAFKYGATINGSLMSGTLYLRCVAGGIPFNVNKAIVLGDNLVDLGTTAQLASISAKIDLTAKETTVQDIKLNTDKIATLTENVSGLRFTEKALEQAPSGGGGSGLTLAEIEASTVLAKEATLLQSEVDIIAEVNANEVKIDAVKTKVDTLQNADFTTTNAKIDSKPTLTQIEASTILAKEATILQTETDLTAEINANEVKIDAIKAKTDTLVNTDISTLSKKADTDLLLKAADYVAPDNTKIGQIKTKIDTLENYDDTALEGKVDAIKTNTDLIPATI